MVLVVMLMILIVMRMMDDNDDNRMMILMTMRMTLKMAMRMTMMMTMAITPILFTILSSGGGPGAFLIWLRAFQWTKFRELFGAWTQISISNSFDKSPQIRCHYLLLLDYCQNFHTDSQVAIEYRHYWLQVTIPHLVL